MDLFIFISEHMKGVYLGVLFESLRWYHTEEESKKEPSVSAAAWACIVMHRNWRKGILTPRRL